MKLLLKLVLFTACTTCCFAQKKAIKTYYENTTDGTVLYADNGELCEMTVEVVIKKIKNFTPDTKTRTFVLAPNSKKNKLIGYKIVNKKKKTDLKSSTWSNYGNTTLKTYDTNFKYNLPFENGTTFKLSQGYNGKLSHQNKSQLDFTMPIGTKLTAVRGGKVVRVVDVNNKHCPTDACKKYNNYIDILHDDGTFAEYVHIKRKGAKVKVGDTVKKGQLIALSGNVGWSTGPHLHFSVFKQGMRKRTYVKTKFKINDGKTTVCLKEKEKYTRNYN